MERHLHCKLKNGKLVAKREVDKAISLLNELQHGFDIVELTDEELFANGDEFNAIMRFRKKYDTSLKEAKDAIDFLRGKEIY